MWEEFTDRTQRVLFFAYAEAARLGGTQVEPEHLLLGLTRESDSVAARVLDRLGMPGRRLRREIKKRSASGEKRPAEELGLDIRVRRILDLAREESETLGYTHVGPEHLLLGILREGASDAAQVLTQAGITLEAARAEAAHFASGGPSNPLEVPGWQRLRARARRCVFFAREEAARAGQTRMTPEHLLMGLLREEDTLAARILSRLGVAPEAVAAALAVEAAAGGDAAIETITLDPRVRRVFGWAAEESWRQHDLNIGTEHLLMGILREGKGPAASTLEGMGATLDTVRREVVAVLSGAISLRSAIREKVQASLSRQQEHA